MSYPDRIEWTDIEGGKHSISGPLATRFAAQMDRDYPDIKYYDRQGNHIGYGVYTELHANYEYKRIAADVVGPLWVSTVWLGMDHNFASIIEPDKPHKPLIFETMCFPAATHTGPAKSLREAIEKEGDKWKEMPEVFQEWDGVQDRYYTEDEARRGHQRWVTKLRTLLIESERN